MGVGGNPTGIAAAPGSGVAYISGGDSVTPFNVATLTPGRPSTSERPPKHWPWRRGARPLGVRRQRELIHMDLATGKVIAKPHVGNQPSAVVIAVGGSRAG